MYLHHPQRRSRARLLCLACIILFVSVFISLTLTVRSAVAAPTHVVLHVFAGHVENVQLDVLTISEVVGVLGLLSLSVVAVMMRVRRHPIKTGVEGMIGARAITLTPLNPEGRVNYGGENWAATLDVPTRLVAADTTVQIVAVEGLRLRVRPMYTLSHSETDPCENMG